MSVVDLTSTKIHLNVTVSTYDAELQTFIDRAESLLAKKIGPLSSAATTSKVPGDAAELRLPVTPVISLTSVTSNAGAVATLADLTVRDDLVEYTIGGYFSAPWYTVVYNAGRATLPEHLKLAVVELVRHLWETQRGAGRPGSRQSEAASNTLASAAYTLPFRVVELIADDLQVGI